MLAVCRNLFIFCYCALYYLATCKYIPEVVDIFSEVVSHHTYNKQISVLYEFYYIYMYSIIYTIIFVNFSYSCIVFIFISYTCPLYEQCPNLYKSNINILYLF